MSNYCGKIRLIIFDWAGTVIDYGSRAPAGVFVEVEVETLAQLAQALDAGAERVLLDNFTLDDIRTAVKTTGGRAKLEVSGGVTLDTIRPLAETGIDSISLGGLTHSARSLDLGLDIA